MTYDYLTLHAETEYRHHHVNVLKFHLESLGPVKVIIPPRRNAHTQPRPRLLHDDRRGHVFERFLQRCRPLDNSFQNVIRPLPNLEVQQYSIVHIGGRVVFGFVLK